MSILFNTTGEHVFGEPNPNLSPDWEDEMYDETIGDKSTSYHAQRRKRRNAVLPAGVHLNNGEAIVEK